MIASSSKVDKTKLKRKIELKAPNTSPIMNNFYLNTVGNEEGEIIKQSRVLLFSVEFIYKVTGNIFRGSNFVIFSSAVFEENVELLS